MKNFSNSNSLEDILSKSQLTEMNEKTVIQDELVSSPVNEVPFPPSGKKILKAKGNAQLKDFIKYIGLIVETVFEEDHVEYLPYEKTFVLKEDADVRLMRPIISYRVMNREYKKDTCVVPRMRDTVVDDENRTGEIYSEQFISKVQFQIICMEYNKAWEIMDKFEDLMINYRTFLKEQGICNYYFCNQSEDTYCQDFREIASILTLNYYVETEKNRVIFKENIKNIHIHGEAVNEAGSPIPSASTDDKK